MADYDLTTLDAVKDFGGLKGSTSEVDDVIEDLITRVTESFHSYCDVKQFKQKTYTEYYDGNGTDLLFPYNTPLISVTEINICSDWLWGSDTTTAPTDYRIVNNSYIILKDTYFTSGSQNVKVKYSAGYETIPNDLIQACIEEVLRKHNHRTDFDLTGKALADGSVTYTEKGFLTSTKMILDKYRQLRVY